MIQATTIRSVSNESAERVATRIAAALVPQPATIASLDGRIISGGTIDFTGTPSAWSGTLRNLDRPGQVATGFFADGVRDVIVTLRDGRRGRARITGTSFVASSQRICHLEGIERIL